MSSVWWNYNKQQKIGNELYGNATVILSEIYVIFIQSTRLIVLYTCFHFCASHNKQNVVLHYIDNGIGLSVQLIHENLFILCWFLSKHEIDTDQKETCFAAPSSFLLDLNRPRKYSSCIMYFHVYDFALRFQWHYNKSK